MDERRAPRITATLTCALPDPDLSALLDPRTGVRVDIEAGYTRPGGAQDVQPLADLGLRTCAPDLTTGTVRLDLAGDEARVIDASPTVLDSVTGATTAAAVQALINKCISPAPSFTATVTGPAVTVDPIPDRWGAIQDLADQLDAKVWVDGRRRWRLEPSPTVAATPVLTLTVGAGGTVLAAAPVLDRETWHNYVGIRYRWRDVADASKTNQIVATAMVTSGPYAITGPAGKKVLLDDRAVSTTGANANKAAVSVLSRQLSRSTTYTLTAVAAYWLRPGHTVRVYLGALPDAYTSHLVQSVTFQLDGTMLLATRLPDPAAAATTVITSTTPPAGPNATDPLPTVATTVEGTFPATLTRTYTQAGATDGSAGSDALQGWWDTTRGNQQSLVLFSDPALDAFMPGLTISKVELWLYAHTWYSAAGGTARIGWTAATTLPGTFRAAAPKVTVTGWRRATGRWVNITSASLIAGLKAGTIRGVTLGPGVGSDRTYAARFDGSDGSNGPQLRITGSR
jgi:hypothetical protein